MHRNPAITPGTRNGKSEGGGCSPGLVGLSVTRREAGEIDRALTAHRDRLVPDGFPHAASLMAPPDTLDGQRRDAHPPEGASGPTTIELKSNFMGTACEARITRMASAASLGRCTRIRQCAGPAGRYRARHGAASPRAAAFVAQRSGVRERSCVDD